MNDGVRAFMAGKRLRKSVANFGASIEECSMALSTLRQTESEEIKTRLAGIGIVADDDDVKEIKRLVAEANAAGANCHWQDLLDILSFGRNMLLHGSAPVGGPAPIGLIQKKSLHTPPQRHDKPAGNP